MIGSIHIAVNDTTTAKEIQEITKNIQRKIYNSHGIFLTIGIYATNTSNDNAEKLCQEISKQILGNEYILSLHAFYVNYDLKLISFDSVISFKAKDVVKVRNELVEELERTYPGFHFEINIDVDFSD